MLPKVSLTSVFAGQWLTKQATLITVLHLVRCMMFAVATVLLPDFPFFQILLVLTPTVGMIALLWQQKHYLWQEQLIWT